jgi:tripartite-type tricarboxylate transporter receptor subunit TctC
MTFVSNPGGAPAINALLGEHVICVHRLPGGARTIRAGKLRALATASRTRVEALPEVPTVSEIRAKPVGPGLYPVGM